MAALHLPAIYQWPEMAEQGGLIGYGPNVTQLYRDVIARQFVELMRGTKPADLPVEQPTKFEMTVNLKTAKALRVELPAGLLARAQPTPHSASVGPKDDHQVTGHRSSHRLSQ
jgi:putative ABC transport system substrate-binding protein